MVGVAGFEPATLWSQTRCATRLRYTPIQVLIQQLLIISMYKEAKIKRNLIKIWYITKHDNYMPKL
jgi:hypothetical protein